MTLVHFDLKLPVVLECDASQYGFGAVISHKFPNGDERLFPILHDPLIWLKRTTVKCTKKPLPSFVV
jgi:hypothetical protein